MKHFVDISEGSPKLLDSPITAKEVEIAFTRLNNNRACGYDSTASALLKYTPAKLSRHHRHVQQSLRETSPTGSRYRGTDSTAETWQTTWPSEQPKTNSAADNFTKDIISHHIAPDLRPGE